MSKRNLILKLHEQIDHFEKYYDRCPEICAIAIKKAKDRIIELQK